nr:hypothetical protein [Deltaproteobacteria bacterium]
MTDFFPLRPPRRWLRIRVGGGQFLLRSTWPRPEAFAYFSLLTVHLLGNDSPLTENLERQSADVRR